MFRNLLLVAVAWMTALGPVQAQTTVVYANDFDQGAASLSDFEFGNVASSASAYDINADAGQLAIAPGDGLPAGGYASISTATFAAPYHSVLNRNTGIVSWSFNVSNSDGVFNNWFSVALASTAADAGIYTSSSYSFAGGGFVGNRMGLFRQLGPAVGGPSYVPIIDITNGLGILPSIGSIRITYNPFNDLWSLYGVTGTEPVDPAGVTHLLGQAYDNRLTGMPLDYLGFSSTTTGAAYFDNLVVSVRSVPVPPALVLLPGALLLLGGIARRR